MEISELDPFLAELLRQIPASTSVENCQTAQTRIFSPPANESEKEIRSEWKVKGNYAPLDLHPDGRRVLAVRPPGEGRTDLLELWTIDEPDRLRRKSWQPHDSLC